MQDIKDKGAITVEAAIVLPIFICVVVSLTMMIKLVYVHDVIQHSIDEAANELAVYSYIYHVSDLQTVDESIKDNMNSGAENVKDHIHAVVEAFDALDNASKEIEHQVNSLDNIAASDISLSKKVGEILTQSKGIIKDGQILSKQGIASMDMLYEAIQEACADPKKEAVSLAWMLSEVVYSDLKTFAAIPMVKHVVKRYLGNARNEDADISLRRLNVYNGFEGLDFYSSNFFVGDEDIDIVVSYKVKLPLPIKLLPDINILQRSTARAWLNGGDGMSMDKTSIWDLPNKQRGMKIEELFGGNLPYDFPVIDIYDTGSKTGTSIKSINLNAKTYQDNVKLSKVLRQYVDDIKNISVIPYQQKNYILDLKKLIIVIPEGALNDRNRDIIEGIKAYGAACGVEVTISQL